MSDLKTMSEKNGGAPGNWESNINEKSVVNGSPRFADLVMAESGTYWLESIAAEKGRMSIFRLAGGHAENILAPGFSARSKVHEYGGGALCVSETDVFFVNASDQQIYQFPISLNQEPKQLTSTSSRFADLSWDPYSQSLFAVSEKHAQNREPSNSIVRISLAGDIETLAEGDDFYSYPRVSPSGKYLCWISWSHPNMPWDKSELHLIELDSQAVIHTWGEDEPQSITQPSWGPQDTLYFVSDITDWWNIYAVDLRELPIPDARSARAVFPASAEFATPQWAFGMQHFCVISRTKLAVAYTKDGFWHLDYVDTSDNSVSSLVEETAWIDRVVYSNGVVGFIESKTDAQPNICLIELATKSARTAHQEKTELLAEFSKPESMYFPCEDGAKGHAFFYRPHNSRYTCDVPPPLIVLCHGGPTGQTSAGLNYKIQYWTNRGFAVVDVNYRGSTGFGRPYRSALKEAWGIIDVQDVVSAVDYLISESRVDPDKIIIKGSSAGGFSVLAALTFTDKFNAGVSLYGIGDLESLASDTHKFEKYYLESLVGPYPETKERYAERSPIHHTRNLNCALLLFQGLEDQVVPANQAREMKKVVEKKGLPVELVEFPDEGHGFRNPVNIKKMLKIELAFYRRVLCLDSQPR